MHICFRQAFFVSTVFIIATFIRFFALIPFLAVLAGQDVTSVVHMITNAGNVPLVNLAKGRGSPNSRVNAIWPVMTNLMPVALG